ncbi:hypothetical protein VFPBJ_01911 [Purpureocillium lilacinum]|uniref:Uncharacterized protein n=1 Tax=Purpureocillium lilacinum TaxID=33203 RepID=A0A179HEC4_PURLI|nr:hypothetical protein VFPBJ_01911 [Purpureocillium lilacinum]
MSIFSGIRKSRRQAKEHNAKLAEQKKLEEEKVPYKHVPTHAATDAFASAPPSWREADRTRIVEQNRRRSAMAASGHHMNMPGVPRVGSSLSHVSYPGQDVTPSARLPRAYSYNGVSPCVMQGRDVVYSVQDGSYSQPQLKGKEIIRGIGYDQQRISPTPSKGDDPSPVESSAGSTSSQDDLEMRPTRPTATRPTEAATHRLHPAHKRRTSDASVERLAMANSAKGMGLSHYGRDSRPPPSMRGEASVAAQTRSKERRPARTARFSELERIDSMGSETMQRRSPAPIPPPVAHEDIINVFPEPASMPEPVSSSSNKSKRLSKSGGKLLKKSRWYSSKPSAVARAELWLAKTLLKWI